MQIRATRSPNRLGLYTLDEIETIVESYELLDVASARSLSWLVRKCDLDLAIRHMPPKEYQAVLLIGLIGIDTRTSGEALGVSHVTAWKRYRRGLEWLVNYLNGDPTT